MQQYFYHPRTAKSAITEFPTAYARLKELQDVETQAIIRPLLERQHELVADSRHISATLRRLAKHLIVIGSGGSGLSGHVLASLCTESKEASLHVFDCCDLYVAEHFMQTHKADECALLVISKSGTTVETLAYVDQLMQWMSPLPDVNQRVAVLTVENDNMLHHMAKAKGWLVIGHDANLCGRFSIFSEVGLVPAAFTGFDIAAFLKGAETAWHEPDPATQAAIFQHDALTYGLGVHVTFAYGSRFAPLVQWWRQGIAESLGKQQKGFFPITAIGTRDQHSQLQLYLDGLPIAMFTLLTEESGGKGRQFTPQALLPALHHKYVGDVIQSQQQATLGTLKNAGKSIRHLNLQDHQAETLGRLIMQWTQEILLLGFMLQVNPFDQPAIEESKRLSREYL